MIIDSHVHILPPRIRDARAEVGGADPWFAVCHEGGKVIATVDELVAAMDGAGVDRSVCFSWPFASAALCAEANEHLAAAQRRYPDRVIGFAVVNPASPDAAGELRRCAGMGLRGVGELNCDAQGFSLDDPAIDAAVTMSVELGMPWTLHCSEPLGHEYAGKGATTPDKVARFAQRHPQLRLVCAHLGGGLPFYAHMPEVAALCKRLWFDTAAGPLLYAPSAYRTVVELCGAERVLFGSDFPLLRASRYEDEFATANLTPADRDMVLGGSARALLGI
jgi:predicted TIM-barrel fold metal-dependent hydrolase